MDWAGILEKQNWLQIRTLMISLKLRSRPRSRAPRRPREFSPSHKRNKIIARKIDSFLGAEANKSKDEHDDEDEDDSLISGSGINH